MAGDFLNHLTIILVVCLTFESIRVIIQTNYFKTKTQKAKSKAKDSSRNFPDSLT